MKFKLSSKVTGVDASGTKLDVQVEPAEGGEAKHLEADVVLLSIGRKPYTDGLGLDAVGARIWALLESGASVGETLDTLLQEYEVERATLEADLAELLPQV